MMKKLLKLSFVLASLTFAVFLSPEKACSADFNSGSVIYENDYILGDEATSAGLQVQSEYYTFSSTVTYSNAAESEGGNIFDIIQKKMMSTLEDLRKIVYVIAGFGLIMFAVMAIFNKISFKHLAYIMIGLSLLALMFPFIEYFSGAGIMSDSDRKLTFGNFVAVSEDNGASAAQVSGGTINPADCPDGVCPPSLSDADLVAMDIEAQEEMKKAEQELQKELADKLNTPDDPIIALTAAGCDSGSLKSSWKDGVRNVCSVGENGQVQVKQETCKGVVKDGVCKKTFGQAVNDIAQIANQALSGINGATGAIGGAIGMVGNFKNYGDMIAGAANSGGNFFEKLQGVSNAIGAAGTDFSHGINAIVASTESAIGSGVQIGTIASTNYETNPTGQNALADKWYGVDENGKPTSGLRAGLEGVAGAVSGVSGAVNNVTNTGAAIGSLGNGVINNVQVISNALENTADKLIGGNNPAVNQAAVNNQTGHRTEQDGPSRVIRNSGNGQASATQEPASAVDSGIGRGRKPLKGYLPKKEINKEELDAFFE